MSKTSSLAAASIAPAISTYAASASGPAQNDVSAATHVRSTGLLAMPLRAGLPLKRVMLTVLGVVAMLGVLVTWVGFDTLAHYRIELLFDLRAHLTLVGWSMLAALVVGVPSGVLLSRPAFVRYAEKLMQIFNVGNTVPSLAVLVLALAVLGIGSGPAILALALASVLPITRNTYEGLRQVPMSLREAAKGLGMTRRQAFLRVELPNALPMVMGGVRTALAINVGTAPLAFLIGADSLGTLIFPGIYLNNQSQLLLGAIATALLALAMDAALAGLSAMLIRRKGGAS